MFGEDSDNLETILEKKFRGWINRRLKRAWEWYFWPELMLIEKRFFHTDYNSLFAYTAGQFVYYPVDLKYYVALKTTTDNLPTTVENWANAATTYSASDYVAATTYAAGDQVYYPLTASHYSCHTATTGNLPTDTTKWGLLAKLNQFVPYDQTKPIDAGQTKFSAKSLFHVWDIDPKHVNNAKELDWWLSADGVQVRSSVKHVWLEFRKRSPMIFGNVYSSTATYAVDDQIRFDNGGISNFYNCIVATSAGESPSTTAASWSIIDIPRMFEAYLVQGAYADAIRSDGQNEKFRSEDNIAEELLSEEADIIAGQAGQIQRVNILRR